MEVDVVEEFVAHAAAVRVDLQERLGEVIGTPLVENRQLATIAQELERLQRLVMRLQARIVERIEDRCWFTRDGHRTVKGWVDATLSQSPFTSAQLVRISRFLASHHDIGELVAAGDLGIDQTNELARTAGCWRVRLAFEEVLPAFVVSAMNEPFDVFVTRLRDWKALHDQDGGHRPPGEAHRQRMCSMFSNGDQLLLRGEFDAIVGDFIRQVFQQFCDAELLADRVQAQQAWEAEGNEGEVSPTWLPRSAAQRGADAMKAMAAAAAATPPGATPAQPQVVVTVLIDHATFTRRLVDLIDPLHLRRRDGDLVKPHAFDACAHATGRIDQLGVCRLTDGTAVDPTSAVAYAAVYGTVRRAVYGTDGVIIDLGRRSRCFTGGARQAAIIQAALDNTHRCSWPGCSRRTHLQVDHLAEWQHGGRTTPHNGGPKCGYHNVLKSSGWRVWRDPNGHWHTYRPDGTEIQAI